MTDNIDTAASVQAPRTASVFVLMQRFGNDYWMASLTGPTAEAVLNFAKIGDGVTAWRIVRVDNLPIAVAEGEA